MPSRAEERRVTRSQDPHEALRLQLVSVCESTGACALVLASAEGLSIAHAGDDALCDELAAIVPFVAEQRAVPPDTALGAGELHVRPLRFEGHALYLAVSRDGASVAGASSELERSLASAGEAVTRILRAA
jgi:hypothetical protein